MIAPVLDAVGDRFVQKLIRRDHSGRQSGRDSDLDLQGVATTPLGRHCQSPATFRRRTLRTLRRTGRCIDQARPGCRALRLRRRLPRCQAATPGRSPLRRRRPRSGRAAAPRGLVFFCFALDSLGVAFPAGALLGRQPALGRFPGGLPVVKRPAPGLRGLRTLGNLAPAGLPALYSGDRPLPKETPAGVSIDLPGRPGGLGGPFYRRGGGAALTLGGHVSGLGPSGPAPAAPGGAVSRGGSVW